MGNRKPYRTADRIAPGWFKNKEVFNFRFSGIETFHQPCMISSFRHEVDENCVLLGYYAASSGNFLLTFQDHRLVLSSRA